VRAVLYSDDMEPVTILELELWAVEFLKEYGRVTFAVTAPLRANFDPTAPIQLEDCRIWQVTIHAETFVRKGTEHLRLVTHNDEQALLLRSALLPGQRHWMRDSERVGWEKGFTDALHWATRLRK
jgi:hypothetical protein